VYRRWKYLPGGVIQFRDRRSEKQLMRIAHATRLVAGFAGKGGIA
jgi:hypothetical protein